LIRESGSLAVFALVSFSFMPFMRLYRKEDISVFVFHRCFSSPVRLTLSASATTLKVQCSKAKKFWVISKMPKTHVAPHTQSAAYVSSAVVVVYGKLFVFWLTANYTFWQSASFKTSRFIRNSFWQYHSAFVLRTALAAP